MSYLDDASLVMIPSGYKDGKLYSVKPSNGAGDFTFTRASDATRVNSDGEIEVVGSGVPRLDYSQGSCPALLLEPQRTNLARYSEEFNNAAWTKSTGGVSTVTVTANYGISPDGNQNAERIQLTRDAVGFSQVVQTVSVTSGQVYTFSVYLKSLSGTPTILFGSYGGTNAQTATLTNEWVRYTWTATSPSTNAFPMLMIWGGIASTSLSADFLAYGYQFEQGAYATSYIPTYGTSVTRGAEDATASADSTGDWTLYFECDTTLLADSDSYVNTPFIGTIRIYLEDIWWRLGGVNRYFENSGINTIKILFRRTSGNIDAFYNGVEQYSGIASTITGVQDIILEGGKHRQVLYFPEALSDADCIALTTL